MSLRIIVRRDNRNELVNIMRDFHEAMVGTPAYINNEIAIVEPVMGGDAFVLIVGNDNDTNNNFVITGNEMRKSTSISTDYFLKSGALEPFDKLTAGLFDFNEDALLADISGRYINHADNFIMYVARLNMDKLHDEQMVMSGIYKHFRPVAPSIVMVPPGISKRDYYYTVSTINDTADKNIRVLTLVGIIGTFINPSYQGIVAQDNELRFEFLKKLNSIGITYSTGVPIGEKF